MNQYKSIIEIRKHLQNNLIAGADTLGLIKIASTNSPFTISAGGELGLDISVFDVDSAAMAAYLTANDFHDDTFNVNKYALKAGLSTQNFATKNLTVSGTLSYAGSLDLGGRWLTFGGASPTDTDAGIIIKGSGGTTLSTLFYDFSEQRWSVDKGIYLNGVVSTAAGGNSTNWKAAYDHSLLVTGQVHGMWTKTVNDLSYTAGITTMSNSIINGTIKSPVFTSGFTGSGWSIDSGANAYFQNLEVRGGFRVFTMTVEEMKVSGGSQLYTDGIVASNVVEVVSGPDTYYYIYYTNANKSYLVFNYGDIIRCQQWNGVNEVKYYQAIVAGGWISGNENVVAIFKAGANGWTVGSGIPAIGDSVVRVGHTSTPTTVLEVTSRDGGFIQIANGITTPSSNFTPLMRIGNVNGMSLSGGIRAGVGYGLLTKYLVIDETGAKIGAFEFNNTKLWSSTMEINASGIYFSNVELSKYGLYMDSQKFGTEGIVFRKTDNTTQFQISLGEVGDTYMYSIHYLSLSASEGITLTSNSGVTIDGPANLSSTSIKLPNIPTHSYAGEPSIPSTSIYKMLEAGGNGRYLLYIKS